MGGPHREAVATAWRTWKRKELAARGSRAAAGKLFALEGCGHEAQGAAVPSPRFTTSQGRTGRHVPNGGVADSASPHDGCTGLRPDVDRPTTQRRARASPLHLRRRDEGVAWKLDRASRAACRWSVLRYVQASNRQRRRRHAFVQPAAASRSVAPSARGATETLPRQRASIAVLRARHLRTATPPLGRRRCQAILLWTSKPGAGGLPAPGFE